VAVTPTYRGFTAGWGWRIFLCEETNIIPIDPYSYWYWYWYSYSFVWLASIAGKVRWVFYKILLHRYFDRFILCLILGNCLTLALNEPGAAGEGPDGLLRDLIDG
tara:strand:+ start:91 stop:405 length:315 start_codon:yes stop_codon:yes gene_type:complete